RGDDLADHAVATVGDEEVARPVENDVERQVELGRGGRAAVAREPTRASDPRHRADRARRGDDLADHAVTTVGDEEVARTVEGYARGEAERGCRGRAAVADELTGASGSRHRADRAGHRADLADHAVPLVDHEQVARAAEDDVRGKAE